MSPMAPGAAARRRPALLLRAVLAAAALAAVIFLRGPLAAWFTGKPMGGGTSSAVSSRAGGLTLAAAVEPDPPRQQGSSLLLTVTDAAGKPVDGAEVRVAFGMAAMGSMPAMHGDARVRPEGHGRYRAELDLPMAGTWNPEVVIRSAQGRATAHYSLTTGSKGLSLLDEAPSGVVTLDDGRRQEIGLRTGAVVRRPLAGGITTVGRVAYDESRLHDVSVKFAGWIGRLYVDQTGQRVRRGQTLFTLYSPELYGAEQEYLAALASQRAAQATDAPDRADYLVEAARQKLRLWDLGDGEIRRLAARGAPEKEVPIASPAAGVVVEKDIVQGASVQPGMKLFRIADLDRVWIEAEVYEGDLPRVRPGTEATATLRAVPGRRLHGRIALIEPAVSAASRTVRVRIEMANPAGAAGPDLRPGMYADVELAGAARQALVVPESAVLYTGPRTVVFVDLGGGRFRPREVRLGARSAGAYEVLAGLSAGDRVVTSGNFLLDAESRLTAAGEGGS